MRHYLQLLYFGTSTREFMIRIQDRAVERGTAFTNKSLTKKSKMFKKRFPMHYEPGVEGLEQGQMDTVKLIFGFDRKLAKDDNWCAPAPPLPARPRARCVRSWGLGG